jgi:hypothetical protein
MKGFYNLKNIILFSKRSCAAVKEGLLDMRKNSTISAVNLKKDFGSLRIVVTGLLDDINKRQFPIRC